MSLSPSPELKHLLIIEDDRGYQEYILEAPTHTLGRDPNCDIRVFSQFVSRRHATLVQIQEEDGSCRYRIIDGVPKGKPSSNGMMVNGRKILACDLNDQDEIVLGPKVKATYRQHPQDNHHSRSGFDDTIIPEHYWAQV